MSPNPTSRIDQSLTLAVLTLLIVGCFLVLRPFMTALLWAAPATYFSGCVVGANGSSGSAAR